RQAGATAAAACGPGGFTRVTVGLGRVESGCCDQVRICHGDPSFPRSLHAQPRGSSRRSVRCTELGFAVRVQGKRTVGTSATTELRRVRSVPLPKTGVG